MTLLPKHANRTSARMARQLIAIIGYVSLGGIGALLWAQPQSDETPPRISPVSERIEHALHQPILGVALNMHHVSDLEAYLRSVDQIADLGANALVIVTPWFQETNTANSIRRLSDRCATDDQLIAVLKRAKSRNLRTALVPIVLIEHPVGKQWRGTLAPSDWQAWWRSYREFIAHFASLAAKVDVDILSIGSELNSTEHQLSQWKGLATSIRRTFSGALTYTANWDRYEDVTYWQIFDVISISAYFELVEEPGQASQAEMTKAWSTLATQLTSFAEAQKRPLLLMEVGYPSLPWAAVRPWDYLPRETKAAEHAAQAEAYEAFLKVWTATLTSPPCPILGFCLYHWDPYHRGERRDFGYGIEGKPSKSHVRAAFERIKKQLSEGS